MKKSYALLAAPFVVLMFCVGAHAAEKGNNAGQKETEELRLKTIKQDMEIEQKKALEELRNDFHRDLSERNWNVIFFGMGVLGILSGVMIYRSFLSENEARKFLDDARKELNDISNLKITVQEFAKQAKISELMSEGNKYYSANQYPDALKAYKKAIDIDPNNIPAYNNKGNSLYMLEQYEDAEAAYDEAIRIALSAQLVPLRFPKDAIAAYGEAIRIDQKYAMVLYNKGNSLHRRRQYEKALECYAKALEIDPRYTDAVYNMACAYARLDKKEEMLARLKEAITREATCKKDAATEEDFATFSNDEDFQAIIG